MNDTPQSRESEEWRQLKQAVLDYQGVVTRTVSSLTAPPIRPVRMMMDSRGMETSVRPLHDVTEEVVLRFAATGRIGEEEAKRRLRPLLKEVGVLAQVSWGPPVGERGMGSGGPSAAELARRPERLNARAVEALIRFYLNDGNARDDASFAETRLTWEAYESLTGRLRRRRRVEASERHRAAWQDWGAAQG